MSLTLWNRQYIPNYKIHLTPQGKSLLRLQIFILNANGTTIDLALLQDR